MEEDTRVYQQLRKLACITSSEEALDQILSTLWNTRRTGLRPPDKKCAHHNFSGDDLLKLFPPDLPLDLQTLLVLSFHKYQNQWKEDLSTQQQHSLQRTSESYQVPSFPSSSDISSTPLWPRQDDPVARLNRGANDLGAFAPSVAGSGLQRDALLPDNPGILPRLKSMTWTMENRVAVISLKLQDYSKSPLGETEVKFQLTRDTLEAMLKSMTYISEQLSSMVGNSLVPAHKKQRQ
ncbi:hypothetical protein FH972_019887 [Carpinus fangiana]|uniref:Uncharacterized protein n=1 Tax=Carpinus fangiana TaxID=176857 RepID=A0A5N6RUR1_9ROSI|nr:hypothetical protein FH972_019887 [Carpinus fangiana]